ncbi:hypothetical protein HDV00_008952 [Rhizophlyctis rosea]|nr:hypothetical protein HDV00_008952 [Rhizophlyctis rosea]
MIDKMEEFSRDILGDEEYDRLQEESKDDTKMITFPDFRGMSEGRMMEIINSAHKDYIYIKNEDEKILELKNIFTMDNLTHVIGNVFQGKIEKGDYFDEFGFVKSIWYKSKPMESAVKDEINVMFTFTKCLDLVMEPDQDKGEEPKLDVEDYEQLSDE